MPVLVKIALRNLREHRAKTLIIGTIIAPGDSKPSRGEEYPGE
jgi:hypothetical protein